MDTSIIAREVHPHGTPDGGEVVGVVHVSPVGSAIGQTNTRIFSHLSTAVWAPFVAALVAVERSTGVALMDCHVRATPESARWSLEAIRALVEPRRHRSPLFRVSPKLRVASRCRPYLSRRSSGTAPGPAHRRHCKICAAVRCSHSTHSPASSFPCTSDMFASPYEPPVFSGGQGLSICMSRH